MFDLYSKQAFSQKFQFNYLAHSSSSLKYGSPCGFSSNIVCHNYSGKQIRNVDQMVEIFKNGEMLSLCLVNINNYCVQTKLVTSERDDKKHTKVSKD